MRLLLMFFIHFHETRKTFYFYVLNLTKIYVQLTTEKSNKVTSTEWY